MIVERSLHPSWLSNAYLIGDKPGGTAVFVDSGAPLEPLFAAVERNGLTVTHLLTTHADADHIAGDDEIRARFDCPVVKGDLETGGLSIRALATPDTRTTISPSSSTTSCAARATCSSRTRSVAVTSSRSAAR